MAEKRDPSALAALKRAREAGGDTVAVLQALSQMSLASDQPVNALGYLQRAAEIAPNDPSIRRAIATLEPKPPVESDSDSEPPPPPILLVPGKSRA